MKCSDADLDDVALSDQETSIDRALLLPDATPIISPYQQPPEFIRWCMNHLPSPPLHYRFSKRQRMEQYDFFLNRYETYSTQLLDLYHTAIVLVCQSFTIKLSS